MIKQENIYEIIKNRQLKVGIVGLGYVGLPLAVEFSKAGFKTTGFDINEKKVDMVNSGQNYIDDVNNEELKNIVYSGNLVAECGFKKISKMDFIAICVPTPLDKYRIPDVSYIKSSCEEVAKYFKKGSIIILESTTYPGTTEELVKPILEKGSGLECEKDFYLGFSPERVDPGNKTYKTNNTPKVVGCIGSEATKVVKYIYEQVLSSKVYTVTSPRVAEMEKILENTYRNINISLANEMAIICNKMGISIWEVIDAAKTKPYGFKAFYPGCGVGGHCIPLDPYYLTWKAHEYKHHTKLIETAGEVNDHMPEYVVERVWNILNDFHITLSKAKILMLGVAYKQDIDDYRESPVLRVIDILLKKGCTVEFYDGYIKSYEYKGKVYNGKDCIDKDKLMDYDAVIVGTAHQNVDYEIVADNCKILFDTKNVTKEIIRKNIYKL